MAKSERAIPRFQSKPIYFGSVSKVLEQNIDAKIGIDSLTGSITTKPWSHKGAWARVLAATMHSIGLENVSILAKGEKWDAYDIIILEHGMEFDGVFNVYGGANDELAERIEQFANYKGELLSFEVPMPDIGEFVKARSSKCSERFAAVAANADLLSVKSKSVGFFDSVDKADHLVIGDSHALSVWCPEAEIRRHDGKTLFGVLNLGLKEFIINPQDYKTITIYFGNIDLRFHLHRQINPMESTDQLVARYIRQVKDLRDLGIKVEVISLLPIEDESRKLPKTGYYKGQPFYGTWDEREKIRTLFNGGLKQLDGEAGISVWTWPSCLLDGEKLSFDVMERPKSVHLSPEWYRYNLDTTLINFYPEVRPVRSEVPEAEDEEPEGSEVPKVPKPKVDRTPTKTVFGKTQYYTDFIEYYKKAIQLQRRNLGLSFEPIDDDLMNAVTIYDTVNRRYAGFSKVLEDLHYGPEPIKYREARTKKAYSFDHAQWQFIHLVHRITGSGASFEKDHGYRNTIVFELADALELGGFDLAKEVVRKWDRENKAIFTSIGNQIPPFNKPNPPYTRGGIEYLCEHADKIAISYAKWLESQPNGHNIGIRDAVDYVLDLQSTMGLKRYAFVLTAFVMDTAEYFPYLVDPMSHCYYGKNCQECLDLVGEIDGKKEIGYDLIMESMCADVEDVMAQFVMDRKALGQPTPDILPRVSTVQGILSPRTARPYDVEDVCCDYIRYIENHIPDNKLGSYRHLDLKKVFHNSLVKNHPKGRQAWILNPQTA
jgi:hypothetical protein